jgi:hypothetical protein
LTQITNEEIYSAAFWYAVGIISGFDYYSEIHVEEIANDIIQRATDIIIQHRKETGEMK